MKIPRKVALLGWILLLWVAFVAFDAMLRTVR